MLFNVISKDLGINRRLALMLHEAAGKDKEIYHLFDLSPETRKQTLLNLHLIWYFVSGDIYSIVRLPDEG